MKSRGLHLAVIAGMLAACSPAEQPDYAQVVVLRGNAYERGFQHGELLRDRIRSLYTTLLETNLMPYLNREQGDVETFLEEYQKPLYSDGQFSYQLMLQSGENLLRIMRESHPEYVDEIRGVADGSGLPIEKILVLNTFVDTMLAFRSVTFFIRQLQSPRLVEVEFMAGFDDGVDNNGDGQTDEEDDGFIKSNRGGGAYTTDYGPKSHAALVEVPTDARIRMLFFDPPGLGGFTGDPDEKPKEGDLQGMEPDSIRIQLDDELYVATEDDCIQTTLSGENDEFLEVIFTPPDEFEPGRVVSLIVQAHNVSVINTPPPLRPRVMRDERFVFTTAGAGMPPHQVPNKGAWDGRSMPPALGFAVRGTATPDTEIRLAHHFALLDSDISHKHAVLFVHVPDDGTPHAVLGWAGLIWGFSGMSVDGLTFMVNPSDTLDNPFAGQVKEQIMYAKLLSTGIPVGVQGRRLLQHAGSVPDALAMLEGEETTFGWNLLLGDRDRALAAAELDADILDEADGGFHVFDPETLDVHGERIGSSGPDDLRIASHFQRNKPDIDTRILIFDVQPQTYWSSFYYRSLRAHFILAEEIADHHGRLDAEGMIEVLRTPALVDTRESMNAVVFEPERGRLHFAMGQVPATDGVFVELDLAATTQGGTP